MVRCLRDSHSPPHRAGGPPFESVLPSRSGTVGAPSLRSLQGRERCGRYDSLVMPSGLHRTYGAHHLHFITCSCYRRLPLLNSARSRPVARAFDLAGATIPWVPRPSRSLRRAGVGDAGSEVFRLCRRHLQRNLRPAFVHAHRSGFVQQIEAIAAPTPLLPSTHQPPLHRLRCMYLSFSTRFFVVHTLKS